MMFGMMGQFLPGRGGRAARHNPVLLGVGALFGGMRLVRGPQAQGAAAPPDGAHAGPPVPRRRAVRGRATSSTGVVRDIQRELRDEFTERLGELQRTYTDAAQAGAGGRPARPRSSEAARQRRSTQPIAVLTKVDGLAGSEPERRIEPRRPMRTASGPRRDRQAIASELAHELEEHVRSRPTSRRSASGSRDRCGSRSPDA